MKWEEIKIKNKAELEQALAAIRSHLVDLRFKAATGALKQVHEIKKARRTAARLMTKLSQIKENK